MDSSIQLRRVSGEKMLCLQSQCHSTTKGKFKFSLYKIKFMIFLKNNLVMQAPDAWPGKDEVKHDCFQPQLQGYDGEYGRPHEAECQKCISITYSIERLNEFGYKVSINRRPKFLGK